MRYALCLLALISSTAFAQATDTISVSDTPFGAASPAVAPAPVAQQAAAGVDMGLGKLFNEADTNRDNAVSREEFLAKANQQFGLGDTNKDGKITRDEMQTHQNQMMNRLLGNGNLQQKIQNFLGGGTATTTAPHVVAPTAPTVQAPTAPTMAPTY